MGSILFEEFDKYRTANVLVVRCGKEAPVQAGKRAAELYRKPEIFSSVDWLRTLVLPPYN